MYRQASSGAPIIKGGQVAKRYDVDVIVWMKGAVPEKRRQESRGGDSIPADDGDLLIDEIDSDSTTGGDRTPPRSHTELLFGKRLSDYGRRSLLLVICMIASWRRSAS